LAILEAAALEAGQPIQPIAEEKRSPFEPEEDNSDLLRLNLDPDHLVLALD